MDAYEQLGQLVLDNCPSGFSEARLEGELDTDWAQLRLLRVDLSGEPHEVIPPAVAIAGMHDVLDEIREAMANQSGSRWKTFAFTLTPAGKFSFNVDY